MPNERPPLYLVMPPQQGLLAGFATGLLYLRRHLQLVAPKQKVEIIDLSIEQIDLLEARLEGLEAQGDLLFGITTTTATYQAALSVARSVKRVYGARGIVIFGGHHATADAENILRRHTKLVDYVIRGEGEKAIESLLAQWPKTDGVPNLVSRTSEGLRFAPEAPLLEAADLDRLVLDDKWFLEQSYPGKFDHFTYVSARGCPLKCKFCSVANQAIRGKTPTTIAKEIRAIVAHGFRRIAIEDNFFAHTSARTRAVCDALRQLRSDGVHFTWDCQTRVEVAARPGLAELLAEAGCDAVYLGVEALTPAALRFLGKTASPDRYVNQLCEMALPALLRSGISTYLNLQFGLPEQVGQEFEGSLQIMRWIGELAARYGLEVTVFPQLFVVYPGTAHFSEFVQSRCLWPEAIEDFTEWEASQAELTSWIASYFAHGVGGVPLGILDVAALARREFRLDHRRMLLVQTALAELEALKGVRVFRYTNYLAPDATLTDRTMPSGHSANTTRTQEHIH